MPEDLTPERHRLLCDVIVGLLHGLRALQIAHEAELQDVMTILLELLNDAIKSPDNFARRMQQARTWHRALAREVVDEMYREEASRAQPPTAAV